MKQDKLFAVEVSSALREMPRHEREAVLRAAPELIHVIVAVATTHRRGGSKRRRK